MLIIVHNLPVPFDRRVWAQCQALVEAGYHVSVISPKAQDDPTRETLENVHLYKFHPPRNSGSLLGYAWEFTYSWLAIAFLSLRVLHEEGFDVLQACNPPDTYFLLGAFYKAFGKRFVFDQHDLTPEIFAARSGQAGGSLHGVLLCLERASHRVADRVISTNQSYRQIAIERGGKVPDEVIVVRNGPDLRSMRPGPPVESLRNGKRLLCCYLGVMGRQDGVDNVIRAAAELVHRHGFEDCHFALLGYGECLDALKQLAAELSVSSWVTFTGRADDTMIRAYLSTANVALVPDPPTPFNNLSTMIKTMEYMAFGLPIVSFDLMENNYSAGEAALVVCGGVQEFAAAIHDLLNDPQRRAAMGQAGRLRVERLLSWDHQKCAYLDIFSDLLAARQGRLKFEAPKKRPPCSGVGSGSQR